MSLKRFEKIKKEKQEQQRKQDKEGENDKPKNPYKWEVNENPKNELTNNRMFRILWKRIYHDCPF